MEKFEITHLDPFTEYVRDDTHALGYWSSDPDTMVVIPVPPSEEMVDRFTQYETPTRETQAINAEFYGQVI